MVRNDFGVILDVRAPEVWLTGSPDPAILVPPGEAQVHAKAINGEMSLILCCGNASVVQEAAQKLVEAGRRVRVLPDLQVWLDARLPVK